MEVPFRGARKLIQALDGRWNVYTSLFLAKFVPVSSFVPKLNTIVIIMNLDLLIRVFHNSEAPPVARPAVLSSLIAIYDARHMHAYRHIITV